MRRTTTDGSEDSRARTPPLSCLGGVTSPFSGSASSSHHLGAATAPAGDNGGRPRHAPLAPLSIHEGALLSEAGLSPQGGAAAVSSTQDSLSGTMSPILTYATFGAGKPRARPRSAAAISLGSVSGTGGGVRGRATSEASSGAVWRQQIVPGSVRHGVTVGMAIYVGGCLGVCAGDAATTSPSWRARDVSLHQNATWLEWGHTEEEIEQKVFQSSGTVLPTQSETTMKVRANVSL